jgi:hypothetical protein
MKNIKYLTGLFLLLICFTGCEEETYDFGELVNPSNLQVSAQIVGADINPLGDGTGVVNFTITADNALSYKFVYNGTESNAPTGTISLSFKSADGPPGTTGVSKHTVSVIAYGTGGAASSTSIEVEVLAPNVPPPVIVEHFEGPLFPEIGTFGPDGHHVAIIDNPDKSGVNTSNKVVEYTKPVDSQTWAGLYFDNKDLDMTLYSKVALKVRSSKGGIKMVFKLENVDNSISYEFEGAISGNDTWEEIIFDFSAAPVADYTKVVLFFDTWEHGDDSTYYFDDVRLLN